MKTIFTLDQKNASGRGKKMLSAVVLGAALLVPALGGQAFAQTQKSPAVSAWGDRDRRDGDRRDNDRHDRDRRDNNRRDNDRRDNNHRYDNRSSHNRNDHRDRDRRHDNRRNDRWDRNDHYRYDYRPGYSYGSGYYGNDYYGGSYTSLRGVVLEVSERSGYARVRGDNGRVYTVRSNRRELDNLRRGDRVTVYGRFQGSTIYSDNINER